MSGRVSKLVANRRARVPFALLGIFLLVLSGLFVVQLDTDERSEPALETDRAMERTDAATQAALADALADATEQAAREPVTRTANNSYGGVLAGNNTFDRYVETLVYLEATQYVETAGQELDDIETTVHIPEIADSDDFEEAVETVTVRPGLETEGIETGVIEAEFENVTTVAKQDGDVIERKSETVTVSVASPLYQLHDRTERFQERLDAGVTQSGFSQRFNARIYALGWARGYAQYGGAPVTEVIANRHIVPSANDAVYRTQKDVFGAADPQLNNAIRRGWLCMAMQDAEGLYGEYTDSDPDVADDLCETSRWLFGDQTTGELPDAPGAMDLLGEAPGMDAEETISVNETAQLPIRQITSGVGTESLEGVFDRIFEIEVAANLSTTTTAEATFDHDRPTGTIRSSVEGTEADDVSVVVSTLNELPEDDQYHEITGTARLDIVERKEFVYLADGERRETTSVASGTERITFEITLEEGRLTPNANIDDHNRDGFEPVPVASDYIYQHGPDRSEATAKSTIPDGTDSDGFQNYKAIDQHLLDGFFEYDGGWFSSDPETTERVEGYLEDIWEGASSGDDLPIESRKTVDIPEPDDDTLEETIVHDLTTIQESIREITHSFERRDILHDGSETGPYGELANEVRDEKAVYLDREQPYGNVGQKAVYEAREIYFEILEGYLDGLDSAHSHAMGEIDEHIPDIGLDRVLTYLQEGVTATPPDPVSLNSPSVTGNVSYEVSGSPTYLTTENVTSKDVPPVDSDVAAFAPMAAKNENYLKLPYEKVVDGLLDWLADLFSFGSPEAELSFQMASEALGAGEAASAAAEADPEYGDAEQLETMTEDLDDAVDAAIDEFGDEAAAQITFHLYPDNTTRKFLAEDVAVPAECTSSECRLEHDSTGHEAHGEIEDAVEGVLEEYDGSTAMTAEAIASGEINDPIVDAVLDILDEESVRPHYATGFDDDAWRSVIRSATQQATMSAANEQGVTLSDTELVEELDTEIRQTLENVSEEIVAERLAANLGDDAFEIGDYDDWVDGVHTPVRVPAGMPLLPIPGYWFATINVWDIEVSGEYARFEVRSDHATPDTDQPTSYVRENRTVSREIAGEKRTLGNVEEIAFTGRSALVVIVPPGGIGVGDRDDEDPECSPTWPVSGNVSDGTIECSGADDDGDDGDNGDGDRDGDNEDVEQQSPARIAWS